MDLDNDTVAMAALAGARIVVADTLDQAIGGNRDGGDYGQHACDLLAEQYKACCLSVRDRRQRVMYLRIMANRVIDNLPECAELLTAKREEIEGTP